MEIEGSETGRLQTEHVQAKKPLWDTQGDFITNHPLPVLKIKLYAVNPSMLSLEDKELGKLVLRPTVLSAKTPEWCTMQPTSSDKSAGASSAAGLSGAAAATGNGSGGGQDSPPGAGAGGALVPTDAQQDQLKIRVIVRMDRPQQLKHCGFLYGIGKSTWRKFKRRYHILIQVSQYTFVMCDFRDKKSKPNEMLPLDGYTVDYIEPPTDLIMEHCSEITSADAAAASSASGGHLTLGLAGRLAKPFLRASNQTVAPMLGGGADSLAGAGDQEEQPSAIQTAAALSDELHNKFYFNVVKEGDSVVFACDDEQECFGWVMALYRATGQAHKPTPLKSQYSSASSHYIDAAFAYNAAASGQQTKLVGSSAVSSLLNGSSKKGGKCSVDVADQRARKHGMDEFISADPCKFQHNHLFKYLQNETLQYRLNDQFCSLGWLAPGQLFVLDEYCARYGVRTCFRHLAYLDSLLDFNQRGYFIDHTLLNYGYDFCASFVSGNSGQANPMSSVNYDLRPDGIGTVTVEERDMFHVIKGKLLKMIERQIANFSYCFPFGKPDGALKATLSLLERVYMKEHQSNSMVQNEEVRALIRKCLEQAALNHYTKLSGQANLLQAASSKQRNSMSAADSPRAPSGGGGDSEPRNGASSSAGSPVPVMDSPEPQQQSSGSQFVESLFYGGRKRTPSTLSSSSLASSSTYSTTSSTPAPKQQQRDTFNPNDSLKRFANQRQVQPQQQQQQQVDQCLTMAMIINSEHMRPQEKLRYLVVLAELCCEQIEENNEYFSDSFAWHSDLMMEHFELFWSLFSVDMDKILGELNGQSSNGGGGGGSGSPMMSPIDKATQMGGAVSGGSARGPSGQRLSMGSQSASGGDLLGGAHRDSFALFQVLNNYMRKNSNFECPRFKAHLCETFRPKLLRYIDVMESSLTRMLLKACEKEGQVNCQVMEQTFVRLEELQRFVLVQLRWPDEQLAEQLHQRLKLIAYELCDASCHKTLQAFQTLERKSNKWTATTTSYSSPVEMIQMINLILDTRTRSAKVCTFNGFDQMSYHSKVERAAEAALGEMQPGLMGKMLNALDSTLNKLARYDEGNLLAPIFSLTSKQGMSSSGRDIGKQYVQFVSNCCDLLRHKINDELWIVTLLEDWYSAQMGTICNWLSERLDHSLHEVQLMALSNMMPKIYADMSLQGLEEEKLNLKTYQTIMSRLRIEEAAVAGCGSAGGGAAAAGASSAPFEQQQSSIFNSSLLSSLASASSSSSAGGPNATSAPPASTSGAPSSTFGQQPVAAQQVVGQPRTQQQQLQQQASSSSIGRRPFGTGLSSAGGQQAQAVDLAASNQGNSSAEQDENGENIADRALQSATRMFKGFWAS